MPRLMSVALTEQAVVERRKTVTRRKGWLFLRVGDRLTLVRKAMGRRKGEPLVRLAEVEVVDLRREPLCWITAEDVALEGFPGLTPTEFVDRFFVQAQRMEASDMVTRIEWRYLDGDTESREEGEEGSGRGDTGQAGRQDIAAKPSSRRLTTSGVPGPGDVTATPAPSSSRPSMPSGMCDQATVLDGGSA